MNREDITDITIGIRIDRSFKVRDYFGEISDSILYNNQTKNPFKNNFIVKMISKKK